MSGEYSEYRCHRSRPNRRQPKKRVFSGRVLRQLVFSLTLFGTIYGFKLFGPEYINSYIHKTFFYEIDTTDIKDTVSDVFKKTKETFRKEEAQNEFTPETVLFKEL